MNEDIYTRLRRAGLALRVDRGALHVTPRSRITPELRRLIAQNRDALIAHLIAQELIERIRTEVRALPF